MKAIAKLKEIPHQPKNFMPQEFAEECYRKGELPFTKDYDFDYGKRRVSSDFHSKELTFAEWIDRNRIVIL